MPARSIASRLPRARLPQATSGGEKTRPPTRLPSPLHLPALSVPAGLRTLRAVLVIPSLFALTFEGFGNLQMALFAAFGGFASLIIASFRGRRAGGAPGAPARAPPPRRLPPGPPGGQAPADDPVRRHAVPAGRPGNGRPGHGQRGPVARVVHFADRRRHRWPPEPGPGRAARPRAVRPDRRGTQADR